MGTKKTDQTKFIEWLREAKVQSQFRLIGTEFSQSGKCSAQFKNFPDNKLITFSTEVESIINSGIINSDLKASIIIDGRTWYSSIYFSQTSQIRNIMEIFETLDSDLKKFIKEAWGKNEEWWKQNFSPR